MPPPFIFNGITMDYLALIFAGALLCNSLPHLASGLQGEPFPSPFAKPRGVGDSSPTVNFLWGFANLLAGLFLLGRHPAVLAFGTQTAAACAGALLLGLSLSRHFGKVRRERQRG